MVFDVSGNLILASDGGVYRLSSPNLSSRTWVSLDGNLQATEFYSASWDSVNHVIVGGAQDTSTPRQSSANNPLWNDLTGADGGWTQTDNVSRPGFSIEYVSQDALHSFKRVTFNSSGQQVASTFIDLVVDGTSPRASQPNLTLREVDPNLQFTQKFVLDSVDPKRMMLGTNVIYESLNQGDLLTRPNSINNVGRVTALAYGGKLNGDANADVAYVGTAGDPNGNRLFLRQTKDGAFNPVKGYTGATPRGIVLDPSNWKTAYIIDSAGKVWRTLDATAENPTWDDITGNLPTSGSRTCAASRSSAAGPTPASSSAAGAESTAPTRSRGPPPGGSASVLACPTSWSRAWTTTPRTTCCWPPRSAAAPGRCPA